MPEEAITWLAGCPVAESQGSAPTAEIVQTLLNSSGQLQICDLSLDVLLEARILLNQLFLTIAREAYGDFGLVARPLAAQH